MSVIVTHSLHLISLSSQHQLLCASPHFSLLFLHFASLCYSKTNAHFQLFLSFALLPSCFFLALRLYFLLPSLPSSLLLSSSPPLFSLCLVSPPSSNPSSPHRLSPWQLLFTYSLPNDLLLPILLSFLCHSYFSSPLAFLLTYLFHLSLCLLHLSSLLIFPCSPPLSLNSPLPLCVCLSFIN